IQALVTFLKLDSLVGPWSDRRTLSQCVRLFLPSLELREDPGDGWLTIRSVSLRGDDLSRLLFSQADGLACKVPWQRCGHRRRRRAISPSGDGDLMVGAGQRACRQEHEGKCKPMHSSQDCRHFIPRVAFFGSNSWAAV